MRHSLFDRNDVYGVEYDYSSPQSTRASLNERDNDGLRRRLSEILMTTLILPSSVVSLIRGAFPNGSLKACFTIRANSIELHYSMRARFMACPPARATFALKKTYLDAFRYFQWYNSIQKIKSTIFGLLEGYSDPNWVIEADLICGAL